MRISDLLRLAADNLRRRKGRTALTVIGVVVGTCAIVVMISLGIAVSAQNEAMLQSWGDLTQVQVYDFGSNNGENSVKLNDEFVRTIQQQEHVVAATPYYQANINSDITAGRKDRYLGHSWNLYGLFAEAMEPMGFALKSGSWLNGDIDLGKDKIPVLAGSNFGYEFEDTRRSYNSANRYRYSGQTDSNGNPLPPFVDIENDRLFMQLMDNEGKLIKKYELVVVGIMEPDYNKGWFTEAGLVMRIEDLKMLETLMKKANKETGEDRTYSEVIVKVDEVDNVAPVENWLKDTGFETYSMTQIREELQGNVARSQLILGGLAAVSLLVAALNIMNTMTMAIYERTREIGVMKVLGCKLWHIRAMFLMESGAIGLLGGVVGVAVSLAISLVLNNLTTIFGGMVDLSGLLGSMGGMGEVGGQISIIPPWLILLALVFATLVGLLSGIAPAGRAVKISALEAIRHN